MRQERPRQQTLLSLAPQLGIGAMSVHRLIAQGVLPAEHYQDLPSVIRQTDLELPAVRRAVSAIRSHGNCPLPADPAQLRLF